MVSKKILGVAIAAAFSSQAFAAIDLTADTGAVLIAKETVPAASVATTGALAGLVEFINATQVDTSVKAGSGVASGAHAYIRFNLTNAKFRSTIDNTMLLTSGTAFTAVSVQQGGAIGDSYVIFDVTSAGIAQADVLTLNLTGLAVSPTLATSISYAMYDTPSSAVNQTPANLLASDSYAAVSVANALTTTITGTDRVASVNTTPVFTQFVSPASATAAIGNVKFALTAGAVTVTGGAVNALSQVIDTAAGKSSLTVSGDLSFIASASGGGAAAAAALNLTFGGATADVGTPATNTASTGKLSDLSTIGAPLAVGGNDIALTATGAINAGSYSLTFTPAANAGTQYAPASASGSLGTITRAGTTIQVPYLTTFADYNQRLVLVNRGSTAVPYAISFTKETGVTATAGTAASGTLAANETKIIKATDIVTLTGGSRTAATVVVTAPSSTIDAATTTVNLSDKSTDTVKLN